MQLAGIFNGERYRHEISRQFDRFCRPDAVNRPADGAVPSAHQLQGIAEKRRPAEIAGLQRQHDKGIRPAQRDAD